MAVNPIGIIGGSGLYQMEGVVLREERVVETPFGSPSDALMLGTLDGRDVAFLPRHGRGHRILPHEINYRANLYAMKTLGVTQIISVSAVGSMKEGIKPGHLVMVDQFVDRTKDRPQTFFGDGIAAHVSFADPVCSRLRKGAVQAAREAGAVVHDGGVYICIEGPMFSSKAESRIYRQWGVDVIGMTNYQEAKLAREAETLLRDHRPLHGLRLLARGRGSGGRGDDRAHAAGERAEGAGHHPQDAPGARRWRLRLPARARGRDHDRSRGDPGRREEAAQADHRQVR